MHAPCIAFVVSLSTTIPLAANLQRAVRVLKRAPVKALSCWLYHLTACPPRRSPFVFFVGFVIVVLDATRPTRPKLPPQAVSELVALSDELNINEVACVELWSHVRTDRGISHGCSTGRPLSFLPLAAAGIEVELSCASGTLILKGGLCYHQKQALLVRPAGHSSPTWLN